MKIEFSSQDTLEITAETYAETIALKIWLEMGDGNKHGLLRVNVYKESEGGDE